jgi:hypothetical protein
VSALFFYKLIQTFDVFFKIYPNVKLKAPNKFIIAKKSCQFLGLAGLQA